MKIIPPHLSFEQAVRFGYVGRMEDASYTRWVKRLPCCACNYPADDPHHIYGVLSKGTGTKVPDYLTIPLCRGCHDELHADPKAWEQIHGTQQHHAMMTMLRAIHDGVLRVEA